MPNIGSRIIYATANWGHKLGTEYFTWRPGANTPVVNAGDILNISYSQTSTDQNGTAYIGNIEYNTLNGNSSLTTLSRIYNDEGYVENPANPQYYYFRHDHLGDNREVWLANTGETVQRTQYYPSGLPWAYNRTVDHPDLQHRKYNGKEFVEMHGYDTYDIVWRQYYPAVMRFQTPDPEVEEFYNISPYSMCGNNMVINVDPDGRWLETAWDVFSLATGAASFVSNVKQGNVGAAILDGVGVVADAAAVVLPVIPGGAGVAIKAGRAADKVVDLVKTGKTAEKLRESAKTGQEAYRQIQKGLKEAIPGTKTEVKVILKDGSSVRKDAVKPDGTKVIIKPNTPSGQKSAAKREKLMQSNGHKTETIKYDPKDPKYQPGSPTYIGPKK